MSISIPSNAVTTPSFTCTANPIQAPSNEGLNGGAIASIVIGCVGVILVVKIEIKIAMDFKPCKVYV